MAVKLAYLGTFLKGFLPFWAGKKSGNSACLAEGQIPWKTAVYGKNPFRTVPRVAKVVRRDCEEHFRFSGNDHPLVRLFNR